MNFQDIKVGVLGAGQLGKMMGIAASNWHLPLRFLDRSTDFPAGMVGEIVEGNFQSYDDVLAFGRSVDVLTIEIEHVNANALVQLQKEGVVVHPDPNVLKVIKDKGAQKAFYQEQGLPTASFTLYENGNAIKKAIQKGAVSYPFVQKSRLAGYDGQGVSLIRDEVDLERLMDVPSVIEDRVSIKKELSVVVARNQRGEMVCYPTVEMQFNPDANLVEFLVCPAEISPEINQLAQQLARRTMEAYGICGLLAVELFLDENDELLINEVAPRPHNSGHHTIESCETSQFEQHLRAILDLPLGSTRSISPAVMINLLGQAPFVGPVDYQGLPQAFAQKGAYFHIYGKKETKPFRKMGHVTILDEHLSSAKERGRQILDSVKIIST